MLRILIVGLVLLVAAMMLIPREREMARDLPAATATATVLDAPRPLPAVAFTDTNGEPFSLDSLAGRYVLAFFGFTNCPDICPITLGVLKTALAGIRARAPALEPAVLFISVDPARDTPGVIRAYLDRFDPDFIGVTTDAAELEPLLSTFGVMVHQQSEDGASYNVVHNGSVFVLDDAGRWIALFGGNSHLPDEIVQDYLAIRRSQ